MTSDLLSQELAEYGRTHEAAQSPVSIGEVLHRDRGVAELRFERPPRARARNRPSGGLLAVAASIVALLATATVAWVLRGDGSRDDEPLAGSERIVADVAPSEELALVAVTGYLEAWEEGNVGSALAAHADSLLVTERHQLPDPTQRQVVPVEIYEPTVRWTAELGRRFDRVRCSIQPSAATDTTSVVCLFDAVDAVADAVGSEGVDTTLRAEVGAEGIAELHWYDDTPNADTYAVPFESWIAARHPEMLDEVSFDPLRSVEESRASAESRRAYARRWVADGERVAERALRHVAEADGLESALTVFGSPPTWLEAIGEAGFEELLEAGFEIGNTGCVPNGVTGSSLALTCAVVVTDSAEQVRRESEVRVVVGPDRKVEAATGGLDLAGLLGDSS